MLLILMLLAGCCVDRVIDLDTPPPMTKAQEDTTECASDTTIVLYPIGFDVIVNEWR